MKQRTNRSRNVLIITLLILAGTRAKKKLMKLIMAMMMVRIATASNLTSTVLLPI